MGLKKRAAGAGGYCILLAGTVFVLLPSVWMLLTSLKPPREVLMMPLKCFPSVTMWENYVDAYCAAPFIVYFFNSAIVSLAITAGELITTILAAYAFSQMDFKDKDAPFILLMATMIVPGKILVTLNYVTLADLGWISAYKALILSWCASVFSIFLLKRQFSSVPAACYEAARIDGCRRFQYLIAVIVPIGKSTIMAITLLRLINSQSPYMRPLTVTSTGEMRTPPVALAAFSTETGVQYNTLMAFSLMVISPILLVYFFARGYIIRGMSSVGLKR